MADKQRDAASLPTIGELVGEWARCTASLADRVSEECWSLRRAEKVTIIKVATALYQAKVFVEMIASGQCVGVTLHGPRKAPRVP